MSPRCSRRNNTTDTPCIVNSGDLRAGNRNLQHVVVQSIIYSMIPKGSATG